MAKRRYDFSHSPENQQEARLYAGLLPPSKFTWRAPWQGDAIVTYVCIDCGCTNAKSASEVGRTCEFCGSHQVGRKDIPRKPRASFSEHSEVIE